MYRDGRRRMEYSAQRFFSSLRSLRLSAQRLLAQRYYSPKGSLRLSEQRYYSLPREEERSLRSVTVSP